MNDFPTPGGTDAGTPSGAPPGGPPGPGWWQASDGNWYPPDQSPGWAAPPPGPGHPGAPGYGYGYPAYPAPAATGTNGFAIASLIASIVSCGLGSILGVIFGHLALSQMKNTGEGGRGLAIAGLIVGYLGILGIIVFVIVIIAGSGSDSNDFEFQFDDIVRAWAR